MDFVNKSLRQLITPDPLWLYKVGTSLVYKDANSKSQESGDPVELEARAYWEHIENCISDPKQIHSATTPLEPLINALTDEAMELDKVFGLYQAEYKLTGSSIKYREFIHDKIALEVMTTYRNCAMLQHLGHTGKITDEELIQGASILVGKLDRYGANGLRPMLEAWGDDQRDLVAQLIKDEHKIIPSRVRGDTNRIKREYTRNEFYAGELEHEQKRNADITTADLEAYKVALIPRTIGPEYERAVTKKEELISRHIQSGLTQLGSDGAVLIAAVHRNYDRAQKAAIKHSKTTAFEYVEQGLNITPKELENIGAGKSPLTFNEHMDRLLEEKYPDSHEVITNLHRAIEASQETSSRLSSVQAEALPAPEGNASIDADGSDLSKPDSSKDAQNIIDQQPPPEVLADDSSDHKKDSTESAPKNPGISSEERAGSHKNGGQNASGWVTGGKVGTAILGSILVADQYRRAKNKDSDHDEKAEKKSKIINYVIGTVAAAGVAAVVFAKPETLVKFVQDISKFLGKGPSKA
jgi:hypothetical protein